MNCSGANKKNYLLPFPHLPLNLFFFVLFSLLEFKYEKKRVKMRRICRIFCAPGDRDRQSSRNQYANEPTSIAADVQRRKGGGGISFVGNGTLINTQESNSNSNHLLLLLLFIVLTPESASRPRPLFFFSNEFFFSSLVLCKTRNIPKSDAFDIPRRQKKKKKNEINSN